MPRAISKATWDQIKIARAAGASYGELAERTGISKGTILAHAHRNGWTKDIALARPKGRLANHQLPMSPTPSPRFCMSAAEKPK